MSSQQGPSNQRSGHGHRVKEHLSLDTRLAARAILEEEELGETVRQPMASNEADSQMVEWLDKHRAKLTIGILAVAISMSFFPIWVEVSHRGRAVQLQSLLSKQGMELNRSIGEDRLNSWFTNNDISAFRERFNHYVPKVLESLTQAGFSVDKNDLAVRLDNERRLIIVGARIDDGDGVSMTWGIPQDATDSRPLPSPTFRAVFDTYKDSLSLIGSVITLCLGFVWLAPRVARRRKRQSGPSAAQ